MHDARVRVLVEERLDLGFCAALMAGQLATAVEAFSFGSYGAAFSQIYFFAFTLWGVRQRVRRPAADPPSDVNGADSRGGEAAAA